MSAWYSAYRANPVAAVVSGRGVKLARTQSVTEVVTKSATAIALFCSCLKSLKALVLAGEKRRLQ
jgi:hypothetical protein